MNRPLRLRAWNLRDRTMHEVAWVRYENGQDVSSVGVYWNDGQHNGATRLHPEDVILMQFTGLQDANGVEICEGDIVREGAEYGHDDRYVVEYEHNGFWLTGRDENEYDFGNPDTMEVIGDSYSTPELLEANR